MPSRVRKKVLSVGVSDSSGGTGVQGDIKTFSGMGVHGTTVITGITAQNTRGVQAVHPLPAIFIRQQMDSIFDDLSPSATKTGLLLTGKIVQQVARRLRGTEAPLVVDPVLTGTYGVELSGPDAVEALRRYLIPQADVVTPNLHEASALVGWDVRDLDGMIKAARQIHELGCKAVLVTGGHLSHPQAIDVLYDGKLVKLRGDRIEVDLLGTGAALSAVITSLLAKGQRTRDACKMAKEVVSQYMRQGYDIGEGKDVVDTFATLYSEAEKYRVLQDLRAGLRRLERLLTPALVPRMGSNMGYGLSHVNGADEVCALVGRLLMTGPHVRAVGTPDFGGHDPIASTVAVAHSYDHRFRCALRISYDANVVLAAKALNLQVGRFDYEDMPEGTEDPEGWGVATAIEDLGGIVPDLVIDDGGHGHEAGIRLLGSSPKEVAGKLRMVLGEMAA